MLTLLPKLGINCYVQNNGAIFSDRFSYAVYFVKIFNLNCFDFIFMLEVK